MYCIKCSRRFRGRPVGPRPVATPFANHRATPDVDFR